MTGDNRKQIVTIFKIEEIKKHMINIVGTSGYIGVGKDEVGKILQYLDCKKRYGFGYGYEEFIAFGHSDWKIKKFAKKLKQIASILTGIDESMFEDQEFKKSYLGEEWDYWVNSLHDEWNGWYQINTKTGEKWYSSEQEAKKVANEGFGYKQHRVKTTMRDFLQRLGTEGVRMGVHPNSWVNALFSEYVPVKWKQNAQKTGEGIWHTVHNGQDITMDTPTYVYEEFPKWIITDCRFENEAQAIKDRGGIVVRVNRAIEGCVLREDGMWIRKDGHPSEISLDSWKFDHVIDNTKDIPHLVNEVENMVERFNLLH